VETFAYDAGEGPAVLLIHGYGDTADGWRRVVPGLLENHRVIALDVPPFGRSRDPRVSKLLDFYRDFFPELFERLGLESATVIGHSLGGAIALHLSLQQPQLVDRLGLVAPAGLGKGAPWWWHLLTGSPVYDRLLSLPSPLTPVFVREGMRRFLDWRLFHDPTKLGDDIRHLVDMHSAPEDFKRLIRAGRCCIESYTGTLLEDSAKLAMPKWLVWGRHDGLVPSDHARAFAAVHPQAEVHVFEDCGHYPHIELPQRFNRLLAGWMESTSAQSARAPLPRAA
jgi:pimeloyl-ACP methyl ester carboxylesterase